jgi:thioredoxin 1
MTTHIRSNKKLFEVLQKCPHLVIKWGAVWCRPCNDLQPSYVAIARDFKHKMTFVNADVEVCDDVADMYSISSLPTIAFYKFGRLSKKIEGPDAHELRQFIASLR